MKVRLLQTVVLALWRYNMRKIKQIMSVVACMILVLAMVIPVSAEAGDDAEYGQVEKVIQRKPASAICGSEYCNLTAVFSRYGKTTGYGNITSSTHVEYAEGFFYCSQGHTTVKDVNVGTQSHSLTYCDDLGHTSSDSNTHQYWRRCECEHGENVYVDCNYRKSGVHTKP